MSSFAPGMVKESVASVRRTELALGRARFAALVAERGWVDLPGAIEYALNFVLLLRGQPLTRLTTRLRLWHSHLNE